MRKDDGRPPIWWVILFTAPAPVLLFIVVFVKWYQLKADFTHLKSHFLARQNAVLAYNAVHVARGFGELLDRAARDLETMTLLPNEAERRRFLSMQTVELARFDTGIETRTKLPLYNRFVQVDGNGGTTTYVDGKALGRGRPLRECRISELCDHDAIAAVLQMPAGAVRFGRILRYYGAKGESEVAQPGAGLLVLLRTNQGALGIAIDFRHLRNHIATPTFPYEPKGDLKAAYQRGNYVYLVDRETNVVAHPYPWHQAGIDQKTGEWRPPLRVDSDIGRLPIRLDRYQGEKIRAYLHRLVTRSFPSRTVDLFLAPNLAGVQRVVSIAPIRVRKGVSANGDDLFGWAIVGCSVEYFEEPKERVLPYY